MDVSAIKPLVNTPAPSFTPSSLQQSGNSNNNPKPARSEVLVEVAAPAANAEQDLSLLDQQVKDLSPTEKKRFDKVLDGAKRMQNSISMGMTFTIYRDATGQFITRFTNKDTGAVTYMPEPNVLDYADIGSGSSVLEVSA